MEQWANSVCKNRPILEKEKERNRKQISRNKEWYRVATLWISRDERKEELVYRVGTIMDRK